MEFVSIYGINEYTLNAIFRLEIQLPSLMGERMDAYVAHAEESGMLGCR